MSEKYNFERVTKKCHNSFCEENEVLINKKYISIGKNFFKLFSKKYVEIFYDKNKRVIGFKGSENKDAGFALQRGVNYIRTSLPTRWMIPKEISGTFEGKVEEDLLIINLNLKKDKDGKGN
jgi:hypothetical protein